MSPQERSGSYVPCPNTFHRDPRLPSKQHRQLMHTLLSGEAAGQPGQSAGHQTASIASLKANAQDHPVPMALIVLESSPSRDSTPVQMDDALDSLHALETRTPSAETVEACLGSDTNPPGTTLGRLPALDDPSAQVCTVLTREASCRWLNDAFMHGMEASNIGEAIEGTNSMINSNLNIQRHIIGFAKNMNLERTQPICFWGVFFPGSGSGKVDKICLWGCELQDMDGSCLGRAGTLCRAILLSLELDVSKDVQFDVLLSQHMAYQFAPCMVTILNDKGSIVSQNAESAARLGCHSLEHNWPYKEQHCGDDWCPVCSGKSHAPTDESGVLNHEQRQQQQQQQEKQQLAEWQAHVMDTTSHLRCSSICKNYFQALFYENEHLLERMMQQLDRQEAFLDRMPIRSPLLRKWLGAKEGQELWHGVRVIRLLDPSSCQMQYCLIQMDVTNVMMAEQHVLQLQEQQSALLMEILPQQVLEHLLMLKNREPEGQNPTRTVQNHADSKSGTKASTQNCEATGRTEIGLERCAVRWTCTQGLTLRPQNGRCAYKLFAARGTSNRAPDGSAVKVYGSMLDAKEQDSAAAGNAGAGCAQSESAGTRPSAPAQQQHSYGPSHPFHLVQQQHRSCQSHHQPLPISHQTSTPLGRPRPTPQRHASISSTPRDERDLPTLPRVQTKPRQEEQQQQQQQPNHITSLAQFALQHPQRRQQLPLQDTPLSTPVHDTQTPLSTQLKRSSLDKPGHIQLTQQDVMDLATYHEEVTILFADIKGFTSMVKHLHPSQVMLFLDTLYSTWDLLVEPYGVYKIETIGDCYMAAAGLFCYDPTTGTKRLGGHDPKHAETMLSFAKAMLETSKTIKTPLGDTVQVRVGIHCGPCSSGVVGKRMPRFCLFGDCVNTANRMESNGVPGCIHASHAALELLPDENWIPTGGILAKGKGIMHTALLPVLLGAQHAAEVHIAERAQRSSYGGHGADSHALATPTMSSLTIDIASLGIGPLNHPAPSRSNTTLSQNSSGQASPNPLARGLSGPGTDRENAWVHYHHGVQ